MGPLVGGLFARFASWRGAFFAVAALSAPLALAALRALPVRPSAGKLRVLKQADDVADDKVTVRDVARSMTSYGSPRRTLDRLVAFMEETGPFGTLLSVGHDWDRPELWRRSMRLLIEDVMPKLSQHARSLRKAT